MTRAHDTAARAAQLKVFQRLAEQLPANRRREAEEYATYLKHVQ